MWKMSQQKLAALKVISCLAGLVVISPCAIFPSAFAQDLDISTDEQAAPDPNDPLGLQRIRDDYWLSANENPAYYGLLHKARQDDQQQLAGDAVKFLKERREKTKLPTFVDMIRNMKEYRGKPVQLTGRVLQTIEYEADENPYGITKLYEASLFTEDSQSHPTTVVFLDKPDTLPIGGELVDGVTVNGYFLKTYLYPSSDNATRKAPLILAKTVSVRPPRPSELPATSSPAVYWGIGIAFVALITVMVFVQRSDRKRLLAEQKKRLETAAPQFNNGVDSSEPTFPN